MQTVFVRMHFDHWDHAPKLSKFYLKKWSIFTELRKKISGFHSLLMSYFHNIKRQSDYLFFSKIQSTDENDHN